VTDRYFSEIPISEGRVRLAGAEAHHLIHVMRAKPGARVVLFDGSGAEFAARVERVDRAEVQLAVLSRQEADRELPLELTLGVALPKGDRQRWLVEKAVELGVGRLVPLVTARSVAQPVQQALARLRRTVIEASKQCGRNRLLQIGRPQAWADYVADTAEVPCRLLAQPHGRHPGAGPPSTPDLSVPVCLAVGPEGGFTEEEIALAVAAGWRTVDLGPRTLRVETAALLLVAMVCQVPRDAQH
jgi:16S rRNA (uracil1498-N3)-methyltransferase